MPVLARRAQLLGLCLVALTAFLAHHELRARPGLPLAAERLDRQEVPVLVLAEAARRDFVEGRGPTHLWEARRWYPYGLVPLWALALVWAAWRPGARTRVGTALMLLALLLAVLEAFYLDAEYAPMLLGRAEVLLAWGLVLTILFVRRRADRSLAAVEAHVASQALLGWLHLLTLPATQARGWVGCHGASDIACAVATNFTAPFWWSVVGLLLMSLPVYLRRAPQPQATPPPPAPPDSTPGVTPLGAPEQRAADPEPLA